MVVFLLISNHLSDCSSLQLW